MSNKTLHSAATVIASDFWINRPVGFTEDGFPIYPSFESVAPSPKAPAYKPLEVADVDALAELLIQYATDWIEDRFGNPVDVSEILALFDGAVESDIVDGYCLDADRGNVITTSFERTLSAWVPSSDLGNAHNVDATGRAFDHGATDWSGANSDGHPVDCDGAYDPDNHGFFDKFGSSESLGYSECSDDFFTHNTTGENDWV